MDDISGILASLRLESDDEIAPLYYALEDYYERKLWHQITGVLDEFYHAPQSKGLRLKLFQGFVTTIAKKINRMKYVEFLLAAAQEMDNATERHQYLVDQDTKIQEELPSEKEEKKSFFSLGLNLVYNQVEDVRLAHVLLQIAIARASLPLLGFDEARKLLEAVGKIIDEATAVDSIISGAFYFATAEVYQAKGDYNNYYRNMLLYLSSLEKGKLATFADDHKQGLARDLAIAALLGDDIYNFGELLLHEILGSLAPWLRELLDAVNHGDLTAFQNALPTVQKEAPEVYEKVSFLKQKICLMALVETVFAKPNGRRVLSFSEILAVTLAEENQVEFLVMRALSLGLIRGTIDQVRGSVTVTWVKPRIMDRGQIEAMRTKLVAWASNVDRLGGFVEQNGQGIWAEA